MKLDEVVVVVPLVVLVPLEVVCGAGSCLRGERDGLRQGDAEGANLVTIDIEDGYVDNDLRLGSVEIVEELLAREGAGPAWRA